MCDLAHLLGEGKATYFFIYHPRKLLRKDIPTQNRDRKKTQNIIKKLNKNKVNLKNSHMYNVSSLFNKFIKLIFI